mmetsp:Transcript_70040/g.164325  ORF Transcript_70040/g.164325 Transcript_70040/m.164325 type:complete len:215 (+) Transcript_70040:134-778(+)
MAGSNFLVEASAYPQMLAMVKAPAQQLALVIASQDMLATVPHVMRGITLQQHQDPESAHATHAPKQSEEPVPGAVFAMMTMPRRSSPRSLYQTHWLNLPAGTAIAGALSSGFMGGTRKTEQLVRKVAARPDGRKFGTSPTKRCWASTTAAHVLRELNLHQGVLALPAQQIPTPRAWLKPVRSASAFSSCTFQTHKLQHVSLSSCSLCGRLSSSS